MDRSVRQTNNRLEIRVPIGRLLVDVFYINYEAAVPGWGYGNHAHSSYELHFVSSGRGTLRVGDQSYAIGPGTFYMTGPGVYHEQKADRRDPMNEYCLNFDLLVGKPSRRKSQSSLPEEVDEIARTFASTPFWFGVDTSSSVDLFDKVFFELENRWVGHYVGIQNLLSLIIVNAVRCFVGRRRSASTIRERMVGDSRRLLVDDYFQHLDRPRSRQELAGVLGTSVRHLNRILETFYSMSFREKLVRSRLDLAADLLHNSALPVGEVAARLGFSRQASFTKAFRGHFGVAPARYRRTVGDAPPFPLD